MTYKVEFRKRQTIIYSAVSERHRYLRVSSDFKVDSVITLTLDSSEMGIAINIAYEALEQEYGSQARENYELIDVRRE